MKYLCEHTDTFGGEANYSWVQREELTLSDNVSDLSLVRAAKSALGLSGVRCQRSEVGESIELRPHGHCSIVFITPIY
tara:strand:- start:1335 stop:1568 length:234 start_codon:yes stop_codon:yes gene_type:complete